MCYTVVKCYRVPACSSKSFFGFSLHRSAERPDVTQQCVSWKVGHRSGSAALHPVPGPPTPVCWGCGFRPECSCKEDQRGKTVFKSLNNYINYMGCKHILYQYHKHCWLLSQAGCSLYKGRFLLQILFVTQHQRDFRLLPGLSRLSLACWVHV